MSRQKTSGDRERALDVLAIARREGVSLGTAARQVGLAPEVVLRELGDGFELKRGRWYAKPFDRIERVMSFLTPRGPVQVRTKDSRLASRIARHHLAVRDYLHSGDTYRLLKFRGRGMKLTDGRFFVFATDPADLDRLAEGAELTYDIYLRF